MLYPAAVNQALRRDGARLAALAEQQMVDAGAFRAALEATASLSAADLEARLQGIPWPGARPSEDHDRAQDWVVPFGAAWSNHREALAWARTRLENVVTVAVDGSEIRPTNEYSLRVGAVQVLAFENHHRKGQAGHPGYSKEVTFELALPGDEDVGLRRFVAETEALTSAIQRLAGRRPTPVVFFDGTLVLSFTNEMSEDLAAKYVAAIMGPLQASLRCRVPLVGYVDASDAKDLCAMVAHLRGMPAPGAITDSQVLAGRMRWGDRTRAMVCAREGRALARYVGPTEAESFKDQICFTYLKTTGGGPPARLDIPRWVVRDPDMLDHVMDVVRAEVVVGNGYPLSLSTADRGAVLRGRDRELFYRALERYAEDCGGQLKMSAKAVSKRRRRV